VVEVKGNAVNANTAKYDGGGIYNSGGKLALNGVHLNANNATYGHGAGVFNGCAGVVSVAGKVFIVSNKSKLSGGGIYNKGTFPTSGFTIKNNKPNDRTNDSSGCP
jgi:predicted outer membrane repeat protein